MKGRKPNITALQGAPDKAPPAPAVFIATRSPSQPATRIIEAEQHLPDISSPRELLFLATILVHDGVTKQGNAS
jgi:hypothetical protein